jgi:hypothetical protein
MHSHSQVVSKIASLQYDRRNYDTRLSVQIFCLKLLVNNPLMTRLWHFGLCMVLISERVELL